MPDCKVKKQERDLGRTKWAIGGLWGLVEGVIRVCHVGVVVVVVAGSPGFIRGKTGRMRLPKEESCGTKKPTEFVFAAWW